MLEYHIIYEYQIFITMQHIVHVKIMLIRVKICLVEVYLLKYYFESHLTYKLRYYRQTMFNQLNIMVPYIDIIVGHFKRMLITGLGQ